MKVPPTKECPGCGLTYKLALNPGDPCELCGTEVELMDAKT